MNIKGSRARLQTSLEDLASTNKPFQSLFTTSDVLCNRMQFALLQNTTGRWDIPWSIVKLANVVMGQVASTPMMKGLKDPKKARGHHPSSRSIQEDCLDHSFVEITHCWNRSTLPNEQLSHLSPMLTSMTNIGNNCGEIIVIGTKDPTQVFEGWNLLDGLIPNVKIIWF